MPDEKVLGLQHDGLEAAGGGVDRNAGAVAPPPMTTTWMSRVTFCFLYWSPPMTSGLTVQRMGCDLKMR